MEHSLSGTIFCFPLSWKLRLSGTWNLFSQQNKAFTSKMAIHKKEPSTLRSNCIAKNRTLKIQKLNCYRWCFCCTVKMSHVVHKIKIASKSIIEKYKILKEVDKDSSCDSVAAKCSTYQNKPFQTWLTLKRLRGVGGVGGGGGGSIWPPPLWFFEKCIL